MPNRISTRTRERGGAVANHVWVEPMSSFADLTAPRILIMIHGFSNHPEDARESYEMMEARLRRQLPVGTTGRLGAIWQFYWPGDHTQAPWRQIGAYRHSLADAKKSGRLLARFLLERPRQQVCLVGHSMGCRVTLETLRTLRRARSLLRSADDAVPSRVAFLMAAAVPVRLCREARHPYGNPLANCAERVLWSHEDRVLRLLFRVGQPRDSRESGRAVGLTGGPPGRWTSSDPLPFRRTLRTALATGHSHYWGSSEVARRLAIHLGLRHTRVIPAPATPSASLPHATPASRRPRIRRLPDRT